MITATEKNDPEVVPPWQRRAELAVVSALLLLFGFFADHQFAHTGFFTTRFGLVEMLGLYGSILLALAAPIVMAASGRRNPARPLEGAANLGLAIGSLWLLIAFPFNFAHLADVLPGALRFVLSWVPDGLGRILLILQVVIGPLSAALTTWKYLSLRRQALASSL